MMSGTSLDGMDLAWVRFDNLGAYEVRVAETVPFSAEWTQRLMELPQATAPDLMAAHFDFARYAAAMVREHLCPGPSKPDLIAFHGQTLLHAPHEGFTFQLGSGAVLAALTGVPVVSDFRSADVGIGGQGAPLVPKGDLDLFPRHDYCLNLGGIANLTVKTGKRITGFDISPCNILLNALAAQAGKAYDEGGHLAEGGQVDDGLLQALLAATADHSTGPFSMDARAGSADLLRELLATELPLADRITTTCAYIARRIGQAILQGGVGAIKSTESSMLVTGGGAHHPVLMEAIRQASPVSVDLPDPLTIDFKEAIIFAYLGKLRWEGRPNTLASVTGAPRDLCAGAIYLP